MQQLCARQDRASVLDRGAEDCQEGFEGLAGEENRQEIEMDWGTNQERWAGDKNNVFCHGLQVQKSA
jgi:hypothetical protein